MEKDSSDKEGLYPKTRIYQKLKNFGIKNILCCWDFLVPIALAIIVPIIIHAFQDSSYEILNDFLPISIQVIATLLALSIAGLIYFVSAPISDEFTQYMVPFKIYDNILFLYHWSAIVSGVSILLSLIIYLALPPAIEEIFASVCLGVTLLLFLYSLCIFISLYGTTARIGHYKKEYFQKRMKK